MGFRPKALLELDGEALIRRLIRALQQAGVKDVVVVLGHYAAPIEAALQGMALHVVHNPKPDEGHTASLRLGLQATSPAHSAVLVALADQPLINAQDIADLLTAFHQRPGGTQVVQPTVDGQPANPVLFSAQVRADILSSESLVGCRQWQAAHPAQVHRWLTHNPHYGIDLDTVEDIEALAQRTGLQLRWPPAYGQPTVQSPA